MFTTGWCPFRRRYDLFYTANICYRSPWLCKRLTIRGWKWKIFQWYFLCKALLTMFVPERCSRATVPGCLKAKGSVRSSSINWLFNEVPSTDVAVTNVHFNELVLHVSWAWIVRLMFTSDYPARLLLLLAKRYSLLRLLVVVLCRL